MKVRARIDILTDKRYKAGTEFNTNEETGLVLLKMGWAEKVEEAKPAKKKK
jgi:hypothetical protein